MALSKALGLETSEEEEEFAKAGEISVYSRTDHLLGDWAHAAGPDATIRALNTAVQTLQRPDVVDALLTLTPLYRYISADNNNELHPAYAQGQGQGQGRQRPLSSSSSNK